MLKQGLSINTIGTRIRHRLKPNLEAIKRLDISRGMGPQYGFQVAEVNL